MARHEHLPIYKAALDMTVHFEGLVAGFSRYHKYTLGTVLRQGSRAAAAGSARQQRSHLRAAGGRTP